MEAWVWISILVGLAVLFSVGGWAFAKWRKSRKEENDGLGRILDMVDGVLKALESEAKRAMREIPQSEVEAAARAVYERYIAGTGLEAFMPEAVFVGIVVDQWRQIAGIGVTVAAAIQVQA